MQKLLITTALIAATIATGTMKASAADCVDGYWQDGTPYCADRSQKFAAAPKANAGEKVTPQTKATFVTIISIYQTKCAGDVPVAATLVFNKWSSEVSEWNVKLAILEQAKFAANVGMDNWCRIATRLMDKNF